MTTAKTTPEPSAQSAAAPSPFPPIADYAFLSDCHTGALVAADGAIDWLCTPSFDSPSVFGSLLDREAGFFRFAPFGINHPTARAYVPGTNVLETTWKTPSGWIVVRDALTLGPRRPRGHRYAAHPASGGRRRRPHARPNGGVPRRQRRGRARLRAGLRLREHAGGVGAGRRRPPLPPMRTEPGKPCALQSDLALGIEADRIRGRHVLEPGDRAYCALSWAEELAAPQNVEEADARLTATIRYWRAWLQRARIPDHALARPDPALGADDQGARRTCRPARPWPP